MQLDVDLVGIVQVFGTRSSVCIEDWPLEATHQD